jgi:Fic family protein
MIEAKSAARIMKIPRRPPEWNLVPADFQPELFLKQMESVPDVMARGKYRHWDKLIYLKPPEGLDHKAWWQLIKWRRTAQYKAIPLKDLLNGDFVYLTTDAMAIQLRDLDLGAGGKIQMPTQITNPDTRDRHYVGSLIEEAITSSQLEGAATTRVVAKEMIRSGRKPKDRSEQMILNNFVTMKRICALKDEPLTQDLILNLHRMVTKDTLDKPDAAGRLRRPDENVDVGDEISGKVFHTPPPAEQLEGRLSAMCVFANEASSERFIHPVIRSIILHFWLAYDHPFVDGNGRTARALFYWSMLRHGYWLFEFVSISQTILKAPTKYGRAFLLTETDGNDLTYFIIYHLGVIENAVSQLHEYIQRKTDELKKVEMELKGITILNHRQRALMGHAVRHPSFLYTIESHRLSHNVVYQTARTDLLDLAERNLLTARKRANTWTFSAPPDLEQRLQNLN